MGHLIPAGTGFRALRGIEVTETEVAQELAELAAEANEAAAASDE